MELGRKHCIQCERQEGANHLMRAMRLPATNERLSTITTFIMVASVVVAICPGSPNRDLHPLFSDA